MLLVARWVTESGQKPCGRRKKLKTTPEKRVFCSNVLPLHKEGGIDAILLRSKIASDSSFAWLLTRDSTRPLTADEKVKFDLTSLSEAERLESLVLVRLDYSLTSFCKEKGWNKALRKWVRSAIEMRRNWAGRGKGREFVGMAVGGGVTHNMKKGGATVE